MEVRAARPREFGTTATTTQHVGTVVELDEVAYVGLRDYLDLLAVQSACGGGGGGGGYEGRGKLGLLPNHEYELRFTTRVTVAHPSVPDESADVEEFVYVHTKGLPGLNAVTRVGEELEPYVRSAYAGGRAGLVYREEPVTLAFSEGFHVAVPLSSRPPGSAAEHTTLLRMQLLITPAVAITAGTAFTATAADWVVTHRGAGVPPRRSDLPWFSVTSKGHDAPTPMISIEPIRQRLAGLTQRTGVPCGPGDPRQVVGTVLVAPPQGEPADPDDPTGTELWAGGAQLVATVRAEGLGFIDHRPFVDRRPFADGDQTAFSRTGGPFTVVDGELRAAGSGRQLAVFGEPEWDHLTLAVGIAAGATSAGIGVAVAGASTTTRGLFATVDGTRLVVRRRDTDGGALIEVGAANLPGTGDGAAVILEVTAFDDRLRASVGEAVVEVDRGELRAGRVCLVADGPAAFRSLLVHGLDMYRFPVAVSRYRSFEDHLGSWSGQLAELGPDALGPETTTDTVVDLWSATSADVAAAMAPQATPAERQGVFGAWVAGLGLALAEDVTEVQVSRFVDAARTELVLIESPEPLDFTEEIVATMTRRERTGGFRPVRPELVNPLDTFRARLERVASRPNRPKPPRRLPGIDETILDAEVVRKRLRLSLHPALANAGALAVVGVTDGGAWVYRGRVRPGLTPRAPAIVLAALVGPVPALPRRNAVGAAIRGAPVGTVLLATDNLGTLLGRFLPQLTEVDVDVPVTVIQSGDGRRAIVVRTGGAPFAGGAHRLTLALTRRRWDTTDPTDDLNTYAATTSLSLQL